MTVSLRKPTMADLYPGWKIVPCSCCAGIEWGGEIPREHDRCGGSGSLWLTPSGTRVALWPGGPFSGVADDDDRAKARLP